MQQGFLKQTRELNGSEQRIDPRGQIIFGSDVIQMSPEPCLLVVFKVDHEFGIKLPLQTTTYPSLNVSSRPGMNNIWFKSPDLIQYATRQRLSPKGDSAYVEQRLPIHFPNGLRIPHHKQHHLVAQ
jgi:hypothetical protein